MKNTSNIILYRKQYWALSSYVTENTGVSEKYIINCSIRSNRGPYVSVKLNGCYYILIDSVPKGNLLGNDKFFATVAEQVWDENIVKMRQAIHDTFFYSMKLSNASWYHFHSGIRITLEKAKEIDQYGNILLEIPNFNYNYFNASKGEFMEQVVLIGREICPLFRFKNPNSLYAVLKAVPTDKEELKHWLIPGHYGNQSRRKWGRAENKLVNTTTGEVARIDIHEKVAFWYWINPGKANKLNKRQVYDMYVKEITAMGLEPVSLSTVKSYINKKRMFLSLERDGADTFNSLYSPYIPQAKLKYSGSQWSADYSGSKLGYFDENGKIKTLNVLRIIDTQSGYWIGYSITEKGENPVTTMQGFKMAVDTRSKTAFELVTDNGGSFTSGEVSLRLASLFVKHRKINLGNKQANPAENFVRRVTELSRELDNWTMLGFKSSFGNADSVANEDYYGVGVLNSKEEAIEQIHHLWMRWNSDEDFKLKKSRQQIFEENQNPDLPELKPENRFFAFANHTRVKIADCRGLIQVALNYVEYNYQFDDFEAALQQIEPHCEDKKMTVIVAYDVNEAHVYNLKGEYIMPLQQIKYSHKSFAEKTADTQRNFEQHQSRKHAFKQDAIEMADQVADTDYDVPYLLAVANNEGKKEQEKRTEMRVEQLQKVSKKQIIEENKEDDDDFDPMSFYLNNM